MNEEEAAKVVLPKIIELTHGQAEVILVDSSDDNTPTIAQELGVRVIPQHPPRGIGNALKQGFQNATRQYIITIDLDGTYPVEAIPKIMDHLASGYDLVSIVRLNGLKTPNMPKLNLFGNYVFVFLVRFLYGKKIHDVTSGMRGFTRSFMINNIWQTNYALSSEMLIRALIQNSKIKELEYPYYPRIGKTKLSPLTHGIEIFTDIISFNPLRFFSLISLISILGAFLLLLIM